MTRVRSRWAAAVWAAGLAAAVPVWGAAPAASDALPGAPPDRPLLMVVNKPDVIAASAATSAGPTPLMSLLEQVGVGKPLKAADVTVTGWVEGSWTYDASAPPGNILTGRAYSTKSQSLQLDQVDLTVKRQNDFAKPFDVGFQVEQNYGWDSAYLHANGMLFYSRGRTAGSVGEIPGTGTTQTIHPKAQYDLTLANVVFSTNALGQGLGVRVGKFPSILGAESFDAYSDDDQAPFFSRSFIFVEEPFTQTGVLVEYNATQSLTVKGGLSRGWNQAIADNNGSPDFLGQAAWNVDKRTSLALNATTGNEEPHGVQDGWRTVLDVVAKRQVSDQFTLGVNGMYAWEAQTGNGGTGGGMGQWYAVAGYASYRQSDYLTLNARGEWFDDPDGAAPRQFNAAAPLSAANGRPLGTPNLFSEVTLGATVHPLPKSANFNNFALRPEVRLDYADHATWDDGTDHYRWTASVEGFWAF